MDAFRKQASKLRDQVAKQQQAVIKQFSGSGYESSDVVVIDEVELQRHQHMEKLYRATRAGRDFQKEIVKAAETFTAIAYKHIETGTKLSEECCRYGAENNSDNILAKAASVYGDARKHVEKEHEELNRLLSSQVLDPLRQMIIGPPLEDARHLAQRYSRMRQEAETQVSHCLE
ncbi:SH3 domain-containing protein 3 [Lathyrus oleraceus]|uniref:Variant 2, SH3 domain-containing protein 3 n=2 Tax=Pisum sativum TaxID=3888 RepID=A0A9D4ZY79_PEA|nr:SH3 domain-containing protein 3-like [Pisum sativum]KAI5386873.1 variant 2, SH3 domain-containing protein 3 [Pisum sativum]